MSALAKTIEADSAGSPDWSTVFDSQYAGLPLESLPDFEVTSYNFGRSGQRATRDEAERSLLAMIYFLRNHAYGNARVQLRPATPDEAKNIIARFADGPRAHSGSLSPQKAASKAAAVRAYLRKLDLEDAKAEREKRERCERQKIEEYNRAFDDFDNRLPALVAHVEAAVPARARLAAFYQDLLAHYGANKADVEIKRICDEARRVALLAGETPPECPALTPCPDGARIYGSRANLKPTREQYESWK